MSIIFGVPGLSLFPFFAAVNKQDASKLILAKHEEGAAFIADGYVRVSHKLGVCYATSGPGTTTSSPVWLVSIAPVLLCTPAPA